MDDKIIEIYTYTKQSYQSALGANICLLIIGGSLGRRNYINGWSDMDLLLVLSNMEMDILLSVKECENKIAKRFNISVDTMMISKHAFENVTGFVE